MHKFPFWNNFRKVMSGATRKEQGFGRRRWRKLKSVDLFEFVLRFFATFCPTGDGPTTKKVEENREE